MAVSRWAGRCKTCGFGLGVGSGFPGLRPCRALPGTQDQRWRCGQAVCESAGGVNQKTLQDAAA